MSIILIFIMKLKLSCFSKIITKVYLCYLFGINLEQINFLYTESGKPYLENYSYIHFNISHSKNALAIVFSDTVVGLDIEPIKLIDLNIAKRFLVSDELDYIKRIDCDKRFYEIWTKKEAYLKYAGKGLFFL